MPGCCIRVKKKVREHAGSGPDKAIRNGDIQDYMETGTKAMDPRLMDIIIAVAAFVAFLLLIALLPLFLNAGIAYLAAIIGFIIIMAVAGIMINQKAK